MIKADQISKLQLSVLAYIAASSIYLTRYLSKMEIKIPFSPTILLDFSKAFYKASHQNLYTSV